MLAKRHHPDRNPDNDIANELMAPINEAWSVLGDSRKRAAYNIRRGIQNGDRVFSSDEIIIVPPSEGLGPDIQGARADSPADFVFSPEDFPPDFTITPDDTGMEAGRQTEATTTSDRQEISGVIAGERWEDKRDKKIKEAIRDMQVSIESPPPPIRVENFYKVYKALPELAMRMAKDYRELAAKKYNYEPGVIEIYWIGGRIEGKPLTATSDIDIMFYVEKPGACFGLDVEYFCAEFGRLVYKIVQDLGLPIRMWPIYTQPIANEFESATKASQYYELLQQGVALNKMDEDLGGLVSLDMRGIGFNLLPNVREALDNGAGILLMKDYPADSGQRSSESIAEPHQAPPAGAGGARVEAKGIGESKDSAMEKETARLVSDEEQIARKEKMFLGAVKYIESRPEDHGVFREFLRFRDGLTLQEAVKIYVDCVEIYGQENRRGHNEVMAQSEGRYKSNDPAEVIKGASSWCDLFGNRCGAFIGYIDLWEPYGIKEGQKDDFLISGRDAAALYFLRKQLLSEELIPERLRQEVKFARAKLKLAEGIQKEGIAVIISRDPEEISSIITRLTDLESGLGFAINNIKFFTSLEDAGSFITNNVDKILIVINRISEIMERLQKLMPSYEGFGDVLSNVPETAEEVYTWL